MEKYDYDTLFPTSSGDKIEQSKQLTESVEVNGEWTEKYKAATCYRTISKEQLLLAIVPWSADFCLEYPKNRGERRAEAEYHDS